MIYEPSWLNNANDLTVASVYDYGSGISSITSTTNELSESIEKLQDSVEFLKGVFDQLKDSVDCLHTRVGCAEYDIYTLSKDFEEFKNPPSDIRPGTVIKTVSPKIKYDLEIFDQIGLAQAFYILCSDNPFLN